MEREDIELLADWYEKNKDHQISFAEREAIKLVLRKCKTVEDLMNTALKLVKK